MTEKEYKEEILLLEERERHLKIESIKKDLMIRIMLNPDKFYDHIIIPLGYERIKLNVADLKKEIEELKAIVR